MKVELTEKEVRRIGYDRYLYTTRWRLTGAGFVGLGVSILLAWILEDMAGGWLPVIPLALTVLYICCEVNKAGKAGKKFLEEQRK